MILQLLINAVYIVATLLFILGLKRLGSPATARSGNFVSALGMFLAVVVTLIDTAIIDYTWILGGIVVGSFIGVVAARKIAMTAMPEMVAILNGFGGLASLLVGWAAYMDATSPTPFLAATIIFSVLIGGLTFTGSLIAWAKLNEVLSGKPLSFPGQNVVNTLFLIAAVVLGTMFCLDPIQFSAFIIVVIGISLILGVLAVISIGGGDMPVVIALLNSYSGLAACAAGFVMNNNLLIVAGALVGASGIILTNIMCKAMNRSLTNVLFSGFGSGSTTAVSTIEGEPNPITVDDAYYVLEAAQSVVIVPGYGLAVAQAQHVVKELGEFLESNGCEVKYAIHPVAGRMPGHMNVLLAEADVPYEQLFEMDAINPVLESVDVCIVIGANDVVNPDARDNDTSPIYGMPIIDVDKAQTVFVLKRSMGTGFAGIQNPLFFKPNTRMLFGDAKATVQGLISEFK